MVHGFPLKAAVLKVFKVAPKDEDGGPASPPAARPPACCGKPQQILMGIIRHLHTLKKICSLMPFTFSRGATAWAGSSLGVWSTWALLGWQGKAWQTGPVPPLQPGAGQPGDTKATSALGIGHLPGEGSSRGQARTWAHG